MVLIDGDVLRGGLCRDLGFSESERDENVRRAAEVARLVAQGGVVAVCALISPLRTQREAARAIVGDGFFEVFLDCSLDRLVARDPKGLYARALRGEIPSFTGVSAAYEPPENPDVRLSTGEESVEESLERLWSVLSQRLR